jgi:hypothetical protein
MKCYCSQLESGPKPKMARRPAHAQRAPHARPRHGPGPGKLFPTWTATRSGNREPSIYIQRPHVESGQTKTSSAPSREPYGSFGLLHAVPRRSSSRDGIAVGPLADARTCRWVDAPPSSGSSAEPYPRTRASERATALVGRRATQRRMVSSQALSSARAPADGWTHRRQAAPRQGPTRVAMAGPEPTATSGGSRSTHAASGSIHSRW